jgi:hypothetical protein
MMELGDIVRMRTVRALLNPGVRRGGWCEFGAEPGYHCMLLALGTCKDGEDGDPIMRMAMLGWEPPVDVLVKWDALASKEQKAAMKKILARNRKCAAVERKKGAP